MQQLTLVLQTKFLFYDNNILKTWRVQVLIPIIVLNLFSIIFVTRSINNNCISPLHMCEWCILLCFVVLHYVLTLCLTSVFCYLIKILKIFIKTGLKLFQEYISSDHLTLIGLERTGDLNALSKKIWVRQATSSNHRS